MAGSDRARQRAREKRTLAQQGLKVRCSPRGRVDDRWGGARPRVRGAAFYLFYEYVLIYLARYSAAAADSPLRRRRSLCQVPRTCSDRPPRVFHILINYFYCLAKNKGLPRSERAYFNMHIAHSLTHTHAALVN